MNDTIAAIATPIGEGGINIIRISGSEAVPIVSPLFQPQSDKMVADLEPQRVYY